MTENKTQSEIPSPASSLNTAVLFLVFKRLETAKLVFDSIKKAKPSRLYIASDGARSSKLGEAEQVESVREYILSGIDWDCEVKTLFRQENLGCKVAVSSAIDWFFQQEDKGIILEDDCLPSQSFFGYCEELLEKYKADLRVWNIGGYKPSYLASDEYSYNFSKFTQIWGWATWADRWKYYDVTLSKYRENRNILDDYEFFSEEFQNISRKKTLNKILSSELDTCWDYQWNFTVRINNGLSIRPSINLIRNIGFGDDATHTFNNNTEVKNNLANEIELPLTHPDFIMIHKENDKYFGSKNLDFRFLSKVKRKICGK
jgi:hypothetical protein